MLVRPSKDEYPEYHHRYVGKVPQGDILDLIEEQIRTTAGFLGTINEEKANYRYAPDKWSIKQVIGHLNDIERLFQYRAMSFARNDKTALPSMEQDDWVAGANFDGRTLADLTGEYLAVRAAGLTLFKSFNDEMWIRKGTASGFDFSVRSVPFILAGHDVHHIGVIKDRYL